MENRIDSTGGARIGIINASFPFAHLMVTSQTLTLKVAWVGEYSFAPNQIISIEKYGVIPFLGWGIRIHHKISYFPPKIVFGCLSNPKSLIRKIRKVGFLCLSRNP
jgi:hypothetical protein